ncbi:lysin B [Mycobacterium Phage Nergal]|nr:lysin B [Mycobacterium Phage Nergal]
MSKPMLLTAQGTGADMWTGYPADLARRMEDLYYFQPIGKYPAQMFPMGPSVKIGVDEGVSLVLQAEARPAADVPAGYAVCGYSQGAWLVSDLLDEFRTGRLKHLAHKLMAGATFGNPRRQLDDKGGRGISDNTLVDTPSFWVDEFDPGDIYANVPNNDVGEDMTAIFKLVRLNGIGDVIDLKSVLGLGGVIGGVLGGGQLVELIGGLLSGALGGQGHESNNITEQILEMLQSPLREFPAAVMAIIKGLIFAGSKPATAPHVEYHIRERSPGVTYYEHAVAHMRAMAA